MAMGVMRQIVSGGTTSNLQTPGTTETTAGIDDLILHVKTSGTATNITFTDPGLTPSGSAASNPVVAVGTTAEMFIYVQQTLASVSTGLVTATFSSVTGVTAEWLRM